MPYIDGKFVGEKALAEGVYLRQNCLKFYLDKKMMYPVALSLNDMLQNVQYKMKGDSIPSKLVDILASLDDEESFSWLLYAQYTHPNGDQLTELNIVPPKEMSFITVNLKISTRPLKSGDTFRILFTFKNNSSVVDAYFNNPESRADFEIWGKGRRLMTG